MKTSGNTILITGGGSGIGEALAHRFHDAGNSVIVAGRNLDKLQAAAAGRENIHLAQLDVSRDDAVAEFVGRVIAEHPKVNVLFNNAGIMQLEDLEHRRDLRIAEATITTNLLGPIRLIDAFVEHLSERQDAAIVNVTSGLAFVPMLAAATYSATKAALHSYTVALRAALAGKVEVIELAPPAVQTNLTPGQSTRPGYQPLEEFADEVFALFQQQPTPREILVEGVRFLRNAEANHAFDETLQKLNDFARAAREA